jgi:hypothetical protein
LLNILYCGQHNSEEENQKKNKIRQKISCIVDSCVGSESGHLVQIFDSVFVQHIQVIILPENLSQNKSEEENEKKPRIFKKFPAL